MDKRIARAPYDTTIKVIDLWLGRLCSCMLVGAVVCGSARLSQTIDVLLAAIALVAVYAVFVGFIKLAQKAGLVGADALKPETTPTLMDEDIIMTPRIVAPIAAASKASSAQPTGRVLSVQTSDVRTVDIAGRGTIVYRITGPDERRP